MHLQVRASKLAALVAANSLKLPNNSQNVKGGPLKLNPTSPFVRPTSWLAPPTCQVLGRPHHNHGAAGHIQVRVQVGLAGGCLARHIRPTDEVSPEAQGRMTGPRRGGSSAWGRQPHSRALLPSSPPWRGTDKHACTGMAGSILPEPGTGAKHSTLHSSATCAHFPGRMPVTCTKASLPPAHPCMPHTYAPKLAAPTQHL